MSNKGETLTDSSDSDQEKKVREKLRKEQKKSMAQKRKHGEAESSSAKRVSGNSREQKPASRGGGEGVSLDDKVSLGKMKFVSVREFKNKILIDIREYYEKDGDYKPGKKGISLQAEQWQKLKCSIEEIDDKIQQMC